MNVWNASELFEWAKRQPRQPTTKIYWVLIFFWGFGVEYLRIIFPRNVLNELSNMKDLTPSLEYTKRLYHLQVALHKSQNQLNVAESLGYC